MTHPTWQGLPPKIAEKQRAFTPYRPSPQKAKVILNGNENFQPPQVDLQAALADVKLNRYPDPIARECCALAADYFGVRVEQVVAGNGSDELISLLMMALLPRDGKVLVTKPDFDMYAFYAGLADIEVADLPRDDVNLDALIEKAQAVDLVIFSSPCNPTGAVIPQAEIVRLLRSTDALIVVDEAYADFCEDSMLPSLDEYPNLIVLRTCSKAFGLAGIRLGFAMASEAIITALHNVRSPFNVNALTQAVGAAVLREPAQLKAMIAEILDNKREFITAIDSVERLLERLDTQTNFILLKGADAQLLHAHMTAQGIATRYLKPDLLRVTVGSREENAAFVAAMDDWEDSSAGYLV
ncbi:MAG: histidinol-phosphate transaminase [Oscillospiraceae bacterium]|nr:histidinol-phosphate transaminase [Oscillospiraceae bacterium]